MSLRGQIEKTKEALRDLNLGRWRERYRAARKARNNRQSLRNKLRNERSAKREKHQRLAREGHSPDDPRLQRLSHEIQHLTKRIYKLTTRIENVTHRITEVLKPEVRHREDRYGNLHARLRRLKRRLANRQKPDPVNTGGAWGGSQSVGESVVTNNASDYGVWISSRKRAANHPLSISNPSSDHNEANTTAYAWDLATFSGANLAHAIANDLGISGYSTGNYNSYYIYRNGIRYRVQILWAVSGHYNHVHVGIRRA